MKLIIFGAGAVGKILFRKLALLEMPVACILDNDPARAGTSLHGVPIQSPAILESLDLSGILILIATEREEYYREIAAQLQGFGLIENLHYCNGLDFSLLPMRLPGYVSGNVFLGNNLVGMKGHNSHGKVIKMPEEKRIFRVFSGESAKTFATVHKRLSEAALLGSYVVNTKAAECSIPGFEGTQLWEMEFMEPLSYPAEWPPLMFKESALWLLDCIKALDKAGVAPIDIHPMNTMFYRGNFIFMDLDALYPQKMNPYAFSLLIETYIIRLLLMSKGQQERSYLYLKNTALDSTFREVQGYMDTEEIEAWQKMIAACEAMLDKGDIHGICDSLSVYVDTLDVSCTPARWQKYLTLTSAGNAGRDKERNIRALIEKAAPRSIIDLAGSVEQFVLPLSRQVEYAVTIEHDYSLADAAYRSVQEHGLSNVIPLCFNPLSPMLATHEGYSIDSQSGIRPWLEGACERLRCDMALALKMTHLLAFVRFLSFDEIIGVLKCWTRRWLIVEYIDGSEDILSQHMADDFSWYTQSNFEKDLKKEFVIVQSLPSDRPTRTLYLCELKDGKLGYYLSHNLLCDK